MTGGKSESVSESELLEKQGSTAAAIEKLNSNIGKRNAATRTASARVEYEATIDKLWCQFTERHIELIGVLQADHSYIKENLFAATRGYIESARQRLAAWSIVQPPPPLQETNPTTSVTRTNNIGTPPPLSDGGQHQNAADPIPFLADTPKLAPITIPKFSGEWSAWLPFIGLFNSIIHQNNRLAPVQKLQYLLNYLEGEPYDRVRHFALTNENYTLAYELIQRRYSNERKICEQLINDILDLPQLESRCAQGILQITTVLTASLHGLKEYKIDTDSWAPFVVTCVARKLDPETRQKFEESIQDPRKLPSLETLQDFLDRRYHVIISEPGNDARQQPKKSTVAAVAKTNAPNNYAPGPCHYCRDDGHHLRQCPEFLEKSAIEKKVIIQNKKLCINCLGEHGNSCRSFRNCRICKGRHHSLLHDAMVPSATVSAIATGLQAVHKVESSAEPDTLLATAMVKVQDIFGRYQVLRALIDPGSQESFITTAAANALGVPQTHANKSVCGIGGSVGGKVCRQVQLRFRANFPTKQQFNTNALLLPRIVSQLPGSTIQPGAIPKLPKNILLADPAFQEPGPIDILLGAAICAEISKAGTRKFNENRLLLQNTELGWIITGRVLIPSPTSISLVSISELHDKLNVFWEITDTPKTDQNDDMLDNEFIKSTTRDQAGRYTVRLPLKNAPGELGASRKIAIARLINLEKSFQKNPDLATEYRKFLNEYEQLGHMTKVAPFCGPEGDAYYLPHHAVLKESSTTTKVRVVFNASAKTTTGLSLNNLLETGPKQQQDLRQIITRWRKHAVVLTADIEKMFRQIGVAPADRDLQRIVWRGSPSDDISEYQLNTITYGTASATYLAVRTLIQLARDDGDQYPLARELLLRDFYMDDLLSGADNVEDGIELQQQLSALLAKGGFPIRKWTSNSKELLSRIPEELRETGDWSFNPDATIKTLGVVWNPQRDDFCVRINTAELQHQRLTKRALLSNIATIFDPIGFLNPVTFLCRTWMQQLWTDKTDWDQLVKPDIKEKWDKLFDELPLINTMTVPRWIQHRRARTCQLHGFCDASEKGYAAVLYSRLVDEDGDVHCRLLTARSRVAPLKNTQTLPRLELAGAVLLANLIHETIQSLMIDEPELFLWCDSQITLAWIAKPPSTWNSFVANRVAAIQQLTKTHQWRYVHTKDNPADVASRGCSPATLQRHPLWWTGPEWLRVAPEQWPCHLNDNETELEKKPSKTTNLLVSSTPDDTLLSRYSSFHRLTRITAWIYRFHGNSTKRGVKTGGLQSAELLFARNTIIRLLQRLVFADEIAALMSERELPRRSSLLSLAPFVDSCGLLRVGGRLRHSTIEMDAKHPLLLPRQHPLTLALIDEFHRNHLHAGAQLTLSLFRQQYWISNGRSTVQSVIRRCVRCRRFLRPSNVQMMGNLPATRITSSPSFTYTGVDYCGPFNYRCSKGRGIRTTKGYIAVFVCLSTKAIHLELVSDLTSAAFLAALKRFISRRGLPLEINSDNGTNFRAASKELTNQFRAHLREASASAAELLVNDGITWRFIPVASPHFGGLWEAGVKSLKNHLKRTYDDSSLTFEEFTTLLCQIEACLNSRPLYPCSSDPSDLSALTPGHFLTGRPLLAPPEPAMQDADPVRRWDLLKKKHQDFWQRWSTEYLQQLQQRTKWKSACPNPTAGELVLLKDKTLPPTKWALGRIVELHPGGDDKVRIVTLRTKDKTIKQPVTNVCRLPHWESSDDSHDLAATTNTTDDHRTATSLLTTTRRILPLKNIMLLLIYWLMIVSTLAKTIITPESGIIAEKLGQAEIKRGTLRLQLNIHYEEMDNDAAFVNNISNHFSSLVHRWNAKHDLPPVEAEQFLQLITQLNYKRDRLLDRIMEVRDTRSRRSRGLLGKVMTSVFGVNDEVYAELHLLEKNQALNIQNHLRLTTAIERVQQDLQQRYRALLQTNQAFSSLSRRTQQHAALEHLLIAHTTALTFLNELEEKYDDLERAIVGHGALTELIPFKQINEVIWNATQRLPIDYYVRRIPQDHLEFQTTATNFTVYGFFDIVLAKHFDLLHITPIPMERNGTFYSPVVTTRTLALNYNEQMYFELNAAELSACRSTKNGLYLCGAPVVFAMNFTGCSVLSIIYNRTEVQHCPHTAISVTGILWQKLVLPNAWLFTTPSPASIAIICDGEREDIAINGSGMVQLSEGCSIKTDDYIIGALYQLEVKVEQMLLINLRPSLVDPPVQRRLSLSNPPPITDPSSLLHDPYLYEPATERDSLWLIWSHGVWVTLLVAIAVIYGIRRYRRKPTSPDTGDTGGDGPSLQMQFDRVLRSP